MENFVGVLCAELQVLSQKKKPDQGLMSMLLQCMALAFYNNAALTFHLLEKNNMTIPVFQTWLGFMPKFTKEWELRRVIFGMQSILRCPPQCQPPLVQQRLPDMFRTTTDLILRCYKERLSNLEENEKQIKEEMEEMANKLKMGEEDDGFVDESDSDDDFDEDDDDDFAATKKALAKFTKGEPDDDDDDLDDEDDSDYEEAAGDLNLYDSKLDDIDELKFMQETMNGLGQNQQYF